jgi:hypothetical protein
MPAPHLGDGNTMQKIEDMIRREAGDFALKLPEPDKSKHWIRLACPFCGKPRAAINYRSNVFVCFHADCQRKVCADSESWLYWRFKPQIIQAVSNTKSKYGKWVRREELRQQAAARVVEYEDSGQLESWEGDVGGDPDQVDRYVLRALNCDLLDHAKKLVRAKRREIVTDQDVKSEYGQQPESPEDAAIWVSWPMLRLRYKFDLDEAEIAKAFGVSLSTAKRELRAEFSEAEFTYKHPDTPLPQEMQDKAKGRKRFKLAA